MRLSILSVFFILVLFASGAFGFFGFDFMNHGGMPHQCPVSLLSGGVCPSAGDNVAFVLYHVSGIQRLIRLTVNFEALQLLSFALFAFAFLVFSRLFQNMESAPQACIARQRRNEAERGERKKQFLRWIALRYKQDPCAFFTGA